MNSAFKLALVAAVIAGSAAAPLVIKHRANARLGGQNDSLLQQTGRLAELSAENQRLSNLVAQLDRPAVSDEQLAELLRLRGQIGPLRKAVGEVEQLRAKLNLKP